MSKYTSLITSQHADKSKFFDTVALLTGALESVQAVVEEFPQKFDLDVAEGAQLDVLGEWIGLRRRLTIPVDNVFFSWDTVGKGWDEGYWKGPFVPVEGVAELDDVSYRAALRLKAVTNSWVGTNQSYIGLPVKLEGTDGNLVVMFDNQDMSFDAFILGLRPSEFFRRVIEQQQLIPKPMGVRINSYTYTNVPVFGTDFANTLINGPDVGHFFV